MLSKLTFGNKGPTNNSNNNKSSIPGPKQRLSTSGSTHNNHNNNNIGLGSNQFVGNNNCATSSIGKTAQGSSRSNSPASHSFIPQPSLSSTPSASTTTGKAIIITPRAPSVSSSIPQIPGSILNGKINVTLRNKNNNTAASAVQTAAGQQSMLDKIKIFRSGQQAQVQNTNDNQQLNAKSASIQPPVPAPAVNSNNNNNNNINKRASSSSGFSSAKSDSSASLCGGGSGDINTSLIVNNKTKPSITKSGKNSNVINSKGKKSAEETTINNCCDNNNPNKTSVNSTNNNSNSSGKTGLIPVRRSIPPPRSRPTSTIIESGTIPSSIPTISMATNSSSSSNITIPKPTACVKGTSKMIFNCNEYYTNHSVGKLNTQDNHDTQKINLTKQHQATSASSMSATTTTTTNSAINKSTIKSELSIAMVSPIMVRERKEPLGIRESDEQKLIKEKKDQQTDKCLNDVPSTSTSSCLSPKKQSNSDLQQIDSASSHGEESASNSDVDTNLINIKPMEPLMDRTSQFAFLRGTNNSTTGNNNINSKFPNNYSSIENGYQSDCTLLNNSKSGLRRGSGPSPQHHNGYPNHCNTELCHSESSGIMYTPQTPKSQISASKVEFMGLSAHHHYQHQNRHQDADSATNLFHNLNHNNQQKHLNCHNANVISSPLRQFCLDDSSSLSSDPGMISGTDISGTTTSSMSSSNGGGESIGFYNMSKSNMKNSSSTSTNHNHNKSLPSSCSKQKPTTKKTDSSMQTESISALSSAAAFKRYLHDHHLIMKVNNTVAPRNGVNNGVDEGTKSLDRLESRNGSSSNNKRIINGIKYTDRRDSSESLKAKIKHDLSFVSNKRPLSSPNSSRINVTTIPGPASKQYLSGHRHHSKIKVPGSTQTDIAHSDTEYIQQKSSFGSKYSSYLSSPIHKRDNSSLRMSSYADIGTFNNHENSHLSMSSHNNPISPWLQRHASSIQRNALTEAESMESLNGPLSLDSGNYFLSKQSRPSSASIRLRDSSSSLSTQPSQSSQSQSKSQSSNTSQLSRSNSVRNGNNNKSVEPLSQPTSPTRFISPSLLFPNSNSNQIHGQSTCLTSTPTRTTAGSGVQFKPITKDEDEIHGSSLSLVSTGSIFSTTEEKQTHEIRRLRRELEQSNEKVITLNNQLATNAHMVAAFEQSLSSMTARLQQLTASTEQKDTELDRLRSTIENLKQQGITQQHDNEKHSIYGSRIVHRDLQRNQSTESVSSASSGGEGSNLKSKKKSKNKVAVNNNSNNNNSSSSWLRSSFTRAFKKNKSKRGSGSDAETAGNGIFNDLDSNSVPNSPLMSARSFHSPSHADLDSNHNDDSNETEVRELKRQLREKEMALTDIRLESLTSAHQLENLKEIVNRMRAEMMTLKQDNERLQRLVTNKSLDSSQNSIISNNGVAMSNGHLDDMQISENLEVESMTNALLCEGGKRAIVGCGTHIIACLVVTPKTKWEQLDLMIKKCFKDHLNRIDPGSGLGLNLDSLACYQVGSERIERLITTTPNESNNSPNSPSSIKLSFFNGSPVPELLPYGYLVNENHISLQFKSASDSLVFDTLIPKSIIQKFLGLLNEHKRIILCGPSGTGKTFLAHKLAEYLSIKCATEGASPGIPIDCCPDGSIATFSVDHKSSKELRAYLNNIAEQCESKSSPHHLPKVIILDNLHHIDSISSVFNGILSVKSSKYPYIIGTMNQATCSTTNLQTQHNFRWVLCANHMEPVKGLLSRYLKRKLIEVEAKNSCNNFTNNNELAKIVDWIPKIWNHLNNFLETHSSSDATIGPRLFLSCPIDVSASQVWFTDLWNYSVVPYVTETTREGIQLYGRRSQFNDPSDWVLETYPWVSSSDKLQNLLRIRAEEVDYNCDLRSDLKNNENGNSNDPLLNMLMRLQEAANYSSQSIKSAGNQESIINSGSES